jgi:hypothetical protein
VIHFLRQRTGQEEGNQERVGSQGNVDVLVTEDGEPQTWAERSAQEERDGGVRELGEREEEHEREGIEESAPGVTDEEGKENVEGEEGRVQKESVLMETVKDSWTEGEVLEPQRVLELGERSGEHPGEGEDRRLSPIPENKGDGFTTMEEVVTREGKDAESSREFKRLRKLEEARQEPFGAEVAEGEICVQCFGIKGKIAAICRYHPGRLTVDQRRFDSKELVWSCCGTKKDAVEEPCATRAHAWNSTTQMMELEGGHGLAQEHQVGGLADAITERQIWGRQKGREKNKESGGNGEKGIGTMIPATGARRTTSVRQMSGPNRLINFVTRNIMMPARQGNRRGGERAVRYIQGYVQVNRNAEESGQENLEEQIEGTV